MTCPTPETVPARDTDAEEWEHALALACDRAIDAGGAVVLCVGITPAGGVVLADATHLACCGQRPGAVMVLGDLVVSEMIANDELPPAAVGTWTREDGRAAWLYRVPRVATTHTM